MYTPFVKLLIDTLGYRTALELLRAQGGQRVHVPKKYSKTSFWAEFCNEEQYQILSDWWYAQARYSDDRMKLTDASSIRANLA